MKKITIYTDGACSGNPGPGGWGAILMYGKNSRELSGYEPETTNNRMELTAAIQALDALKEPCEVALYTDSAYLCRAFNERWIYNWMRNGWQTASKKPVENREMCIRDRDGRARKAVPQDAGRRYAAKRYPCGSRPACT